jgi:acyl transferase domain-containing protein
VPAGPRPQQWQVLPLSARGEPALRVMAAQLAEHLERQPALDLAAVAGTLQTGRRRLEQRGAVAARDAVSAAAALRELATRPVRPVAGPPEVTLMFPGQGVQRAGMAADLYRSEDVFRTEFDRCAELVLPHLGQDLRTVVFGSDHAGGVALQDTGVAQPALFAVEYALAMTWAAYGVRPAAMIGHSLGEYVAACLAGVFGLEQALTVVTLRGRLMSGSPGGGMMSVPLAAAEILPLLRHRPVEVAAVNAPALTVLSGASGALAEVAAELRASGVAARPLHVGYGFHSSLMDGILATYEDALRGQRLQPPTIPFVSNLTGTWITAAEATDPGYWAAQLRRTVRFSDGVTELLRRPGRLLLEVGPGRTLTTLVSQHPAGGPAAVVATLGAHRAGPGEDAGSFAEALGALWTAGADLDWAAQGDLPPRRKVALPSYPFQRTRYWLGNSSGPPAAAAPPQTAAAPLQTTAAPAQSSEQAVAGIWQDLLGVRDIAPDEDFFALGGDSWLAVQIISRIRADLDVVITLRDFFADPTITGVTGVVAGRLRQA